ncbi:MAG: type ISP restriction/modification enzyme [Thermodesulfobacteriota bacterium]
MKGDNQVVRGRREGLRYDPSEARVYINQSQYFAPAPPEVWAYQVGGYQVCGKWLKDRAGRRLELGDIRAYCRIVTALKLTLGLQQEIDALYPQVESETVPWGEIGNRR